MVKAASVRKLDSALPAMSLEKWLRVEAGPGAQFHWEVNDCGEQSGAPNAETQIPTCVEVDAFLRDGREIVVLVANERPKKDGPPQWKIYVAQLVTPHERINLRQLSDLPVELIKTHQLVNYPEIAQ